MHEELGAHKTRKADPNWPNYTYCKAEWQTVQLQGSGWGVVHQLAGYERCASLVLQMCADM